MYGNPLVHHVLLFGCQDVIPANLTPSFCAMTTQACTSIVLLPPTIPPNSGINIGLNGLQSILLQIHYENPLHLNNQLDVASGYEIFWAARSPTNIPIGVSVLGSINIALPPNQPNLNATGYCVIDPTKVGPDGVTVLYNVWHMHLTGMSMNTIVIRNGVQIAELGHQNHYDWKFQGTYGYPSLFPLNNTEQASFKLYGGDILITQCNYNTSGLSNWTLLGEGTYDEMCFNFLVHYPDMGINSCMQQLPPLELEACIVTGPCANLTLACQKDAQCWADLQAVTSSGFLPFDTNIDLGELGICYFQNCDAPLPNYTAIPPLCAAASQSAAVSSSQVGPFVTLLAMLVALLLA